jgi:U3 small nucleolar RNA-associated protein 25
MQELVFYQLPDHAAFYSDLVTLAGTVGAGEAAAVTVLFSRFDALALERVAGTARAKKMTASNRNIFIFS